MVSIRYIYPVYVEVLCLIFMGIRNVGCEC